MMYTAQIKMKNNQTITFDFASGYLTDIDPLNGVEVELNDSHGFGQVGDTISSYEIKSVTREVKGICIDIGTAQRLNDVLLPASEGTLTVNGKYACNFIVEKAPYIIKKKTGKRKFMFEIRCPIPFWQTPSPTSYNLGGYKKAFKFPVNYHTHMFGKKVGGYVNCKNIGAIPVPYRLSITSLSTSGNFTLTDIKTNRVIKINASVNKGETLIFSTENDEVTLTKIHTDGSAEDLFRFIDESTDLLKLQPGDNLIKMVAGTGDLVARAIITAPVYISGVVV